MTAKRQLSRLQDNAGPRMIMAQDAQQEQDTAGSSDRSTDTSGSSNTMAMRPVSPPSNGHEERHDRPDPPLQGKSNAQHQATQPRKPRRGHTIVNLDEEQARTGEGSEKGGQSGGSAKQEAGNPKPLQAKSEKESSRLEDNNRAEHRNKQQDEGDEGELQGDPNHSPPPPPHAHRPGLPRLWASITRLNPKSPRSVLHSLNLFRWHLVVGIFVPLISACIFYACNTDVHITITDSIFMCTSALTLTGLSSVLLADMSFGQQFILYLLFQLGSLQFVSILVLFVRRSAFSKRFDPSKSYFPRKDIGMEDAEAQAANEVLVADREDLPRLDPGGSKLEARKPRVGGGRVKKTLERVKTRTGSWPDPRRRKSRSEAQPSTRSADADGQNVVREDVQEDNTGTHGFTPDRTHSPEPMHASDDAVEQDSQRHEARHRDGRSLSRSDGNKARRQPSPAYDLPLRRTTRFSTTAPSASSSGTGGNRRKPSAASGTRGGFPNPIQAIFQEGVHQLRQRTVKSVNEFDIHSGLAQQMEGHRGLARQLQEGDRDVQHDGEGEAQDVHETAPARRETIIGNPLARASTATGRRLSRAATERELTKEAHVVLAQLEISGMTMLMYIVVVWWIGLQLLAVIVWAPYFSAGYYDEVFRQYNPSVSKTWFAVFQAASMLNNSGLSLVDGSLTPFRTCYIMLLPGIFLILVGNLGYPIAVRFSVWLLHTTLRKARKLRYVSSFVLAHPRRIFYYMYPPYETFALLAAVVILTSIDWGCFFLLDIDYMSPTVYASKWSAAVCGLIQAVAVRSAGFYTESLYTISPALIILYTFMMLFAIYPIALAIRATNVYEERSLGISDDTEHTISSGMAHLRREKGYTTFHLREQLAYDVWYIILSVWLICIVERNNIGIVNAEPSGGIDMFSILFEVSSAYANVGFSIGSPDTDTSISGNLRHLSKLILCVTMIRGRTRGLPILVDRAVLTPRQLARHGDPAEGFDDTEDVVEDDAPRHEE